MGPLMFIFDVLNAHKGFAESTMESDMQCLRGEHGVLPMAVHGLRKYILGTANLQEKC